MSEIDANGCEHCGTKEGVEMECSRTQYDFEGMIGSLEDPNRDIPLCRPCAEEHHDYWNGVWADYYSGLL